MQPFTLRLIIAASLFTLITSGSAIWWVRRIPENPEIPAARSSIELRSPRDSFDPTIYSVPFCKLVKASRLYDRKLIRMQAVVVNDIDWVYVASDACPDENGVVQVVRPTESNDKLIESATHDPIGPLLDKLGRQGRPLEINAGLLGRFYAGGRDGRGSHQFAIVTANNARPTGRLARR